MKFSVTINNQGVLYDATDLCEGEIKLESHRRGFPAKLDFRILKNGNISFSEGNEVTLSVEGAGMFKGYIFKIRNDSSPIAGITAYDQMRYLKNKDTYVYSQKTAGDVLKMVADDYGLALGSISGTDYVIPNRVEDMQTLMDIIYNAIDLTVIHTGKLFVLYDGFGGLSLKEISEMAVNKVISSEGEMTGFDYTTDIDTNTYNKIKLVRDNGDSGKRESYIAMDSGNIKKWGILLLHEKVDENMTEGQIVQRANQLLKIHNKVNRTLTAESLTGDTQIRAGNSIAVEIKDIGGINIYQRLIIEKCVHTIKNNEHTMKLDFTGDINGQYGRAD